MSDKGDFNLYRSQFSDVDYLEDFNVAMVKWKKFCRGDDYRNTLLYALDIMENNAGCHYAADTRQGFENDEADTQWIFDFFLPMAAMSDCKAVFFIIDNDNSLKDELEGQSSEIKKYVNVHYCFGLDDVKRILEDKYRS